MDKITAGVVIVAVICLTVIAIQSGSGETGIAAIAGLITGGGTGYAIGKGNKE